MTEPTQAVALTTGQEPTTTQQSTEPTPGAAASQAGGPPPPGAAGRVEDLPDWAQKELREVRQEAAKYRKERQEAETAAKKAEDDRLAQQAQWQELAQKRQERIAELEPQAKLAIDLAELVRKQINAEIAEWPETVKGMAPTGEVSPLEMLSWLERARPLAKELMADKGVVAGNSRSPRPISHEQQGKADQDLRAQYERKAVQRYR